MPEKGDLKKIKTLHAVFSMGAKTLEVPMELFALNRRRLCERLRCNGVTGNDFVVLQGGDIQSFYDTDTEYNVFRQEPFFFWAFGVTDPGCYGVINVKNDSAHLFVPRLSQEYTVWMGKLPTLEEYKLKYQVENVHFTDELAESPTSNESAQKSVDSDAKGSPQTELNDAKESPKIPQDDGKESPKQVDDHEHPCICDLKLPRKSLSNEERYALAKNYCREVPKRPSRIGGTSTSTLPGVSVPEEVVTKQEESPLGDVPKESVNENTTQVTTVAKPTITSKSTFPPVSEDDARKNISRNKPPKIAVRMNKTASLRLKHNYYCGIKPYDETKRRTKKRDEKDDTQNGKTADDNKCAFLRCRLNK